MNLPKRKNMRLSKFDYTQPGSYYITICTHERRPILSDVIRTETAVVRLTELGRITETTLRTLAGRYEIQLDAWIIMPDHIHMVLTVEKDAPLSVGQFVGALKSIVSNRWQKICDENNERMGKLWQRNFYDHIIRNEADFIEKNKLHRRKSGTLVGKT